MSNTSLIIPRTLHQTLKGHIGPVHITRYAKGSAKYVLTGGQDRSIRLFNPDTANQIQVFNAHGYEVLGITVAHDNAKFASSGGDRSVFVWDVATAQTTRRIPGHRGRINVVEFNFDASVVASGSFDAEVRLWDLRATSRQPIQILDEARDAIQALHVGSSQIITGSVDGNMRVYDLRMGELRTDFLGPPITSIVPTKDGQTALVSTLDSTLRLMDLGTGKMLNQFKSHHMESYRCRACFGQQEATVICGDENGQVWAWDLVNAEKPLAPAPPPRVHDKVCLWTEYHPSEKEMVTASGDGSVKVWR